MRFDGENVFSLVGNLDDNGSRVMVVGPGAAGSQVVVAPTGSGRNVVVVMVAYWYMWWLLKGVGDCLLLVAATPIGRGSEL